MKGTCSVLTFITCILIACAASNNSKRDSAGFERLEKYIDVGTHKVWLMISDMPSDYTIILEAGGGRFSDVYKSIQDTFSKLTGYRVISYDRSGFGSSELGPADLTAPGEVKVLRKGLDIMNSPYHKLIIAWGCGHDIMTENP
jgi:hypothetical protein